MKALWALAANHDLLFFDRNSGVLASRVEAGRFLATAEVGKVRREFKRHAGRWSWHWQVEFHPCAGWSMRFYARGGAESREHAKACAVAFMRMAFKNAAPAR